MKGWTSRSGLILDRDWGQGYIERENVSSGLNLKGPEIEKISDSLHALREALLSLVWQVSDLGKKSFSRGMKSSSFIFPTSGLLDSALRNIYSLLLS